MRNLIFFTTSVLLLLGCSSKEDKAFFGKYEKGIEYHTQLQKTETTNLKDGDFTKALLTATYLYEDKPELLAKDDNRSEDFIVGIYVDDDDGSFDLIDNEPLVFVTKINNSQIGSYGIYDYEINVPATLQKQIGVIDMLSVYVELQ